MLTRTIEMAASQYRLRIDRLKKERDDCAGSRLLINRRKDRICYYEVQDGKRRGITTDRKRVHALARGQYHRLWLESLRADLNMCEFMVLAMKRSRAKEELRKLYSRYRAGGIDMLQLLRTQAQRKDVGRQSENPYAREELKWASTGGILTRSKSEREFCNQMEDLYVPYQYERRIKVDMTGMEDVKGVFYEEGKPWKYYYPDFTIFLADGSLLIIEHLGRMDKQDYRQSNGEKILVLLRSGFVDQDHLLVTFEADLADPKRLRQFNKDRILPLV